MRCTPNPAHVRAFSGFILNDEANILNPSHVRPSLLNVLTTEDYDLWLRVAQAGFTVSFIDDVLGSFRRHNASASSAPIRHLNAELSVIDDHFRTRLPQGVKEHKRRRALAYYTAARTFSKDGQTWDGFRMFASSLRMSPLKARTWAGLGVHLISLLQNPLNRTRRD